MAKWQGDLCSSLQGMHQLQVLLSGQVPRVLARTPCVWASNPSAHQYLPGNQWERGGLSGGGPPAYTGTEYGAGMAFSGLRTVSQSPALTSALRERSAQLDFQGEVYLSIWTSKTIS